MIYENFADIYIGLSRELEILVYPFTDFVKGGIANYFDLLDPSKPYGAKRIRTADPLHAIQITN